MNIAAYLLQFILLIFAPFFSSRLSFLSFLVFPPVLFLIISSFLHLSGYFMMLHQIITQIAEPVAR